MSNSLIGDGPGTASATVAVRPSAPWYPWERTTTITIAARAITPAMVTRATLSQSHVGRRSGARQPSAAGGGRIVDHESDCTDGQGQAALRQALMGTSFSWTCGVDLVVYGDPTYTTEIDGDGVWVYYTNTIDPGNSPADTVITIEFFCGTDYTGHMIMGPLSALNDAALHKIVSQSHQKYC